MLKSKCGNILAKAATLRINLNLDGVPMTSVSHAHPSHSHSQTFAIFVFFLSLFVPLRPLSSELLPLDQNYLFFYDLHMIRLKHELSYRSTGLHSLYGFVDIIAVAGSSRLADDTVDDGVLVWLGAISVVVQGGALAFFEVPILVIIVGLERSVVFLLLELHVDLPY